MPGILAREGQREIRDTDPGTQGEGQEIRVLHCQAKVHVEPPEAGRGQEVP